MTLDKASFPAPDIGFVCSLNSEAESEFVLSENWKAANRHFTWIRSILSLISSDTHLLPSPTKV